MPFERGRSRKIENRNSPLPPPLPPNEQKTSTSVRNTPDHLLTRFLNNFLLLVDSTCGVSVLRWQANALWNNRKNLSEMQVIPYFPRGRQSLSFPPSLFRARTKFSPVNVARKFAFSGLQTRRTHTWSLWVPLACEGSLSLLFSFRANWQWCFTYILRVPKALLESRALQGLRERR